MGDHTDRIEEEGYYKISHSADTKLVSSKRASDSCHGVAYGENGERDIVTMRKVPDDEVNAPEGTGTDAGNTAETRPGNAVASTRETPADSDHADVTMGMSPIVASVVEGVVSAAVDVAVDRLLEWAGDVALPKLREYAGSACEVIRDIDKPLKAKAVLEQYDEDLRRKALLEEAQETNLAIDSICQGANNTADLLAKEANGDLASALDGFRGRADEENRERLVRETLLRCLAHIPSYRATVNDQLVRIQGLLEGDPRLDGDATLVEVAELLLAMEDAGGTTPIDEEALLSVINAAKRGDAGSDGEATASVNA